MIKDFEKRYLDTIPSSKTVKVYPYNPAFKKIAEDVISKIKGAITNIDVVHMGASGLEISGQGDIDIYALFERNEFSNTLNAIIKIFGKPTKLNNNSAEWDLSNEQQEITLYLDTLENPSMLRQYKVFTILKSNPDLLNEYQQRKEQMNGKSYREYQRIKYEFYNKILLKYGRH